MSVDEHHEKGAGTREIRPLEGLGGVRQIQGNLDASGLTFVIAVSRFNESLTEALLRSVIRELTALGAIDERITVIRTPGAYETPAVLHRVLQIRSYSAAIALGAIIEGETSHAEMITRQITQAISDTSRYLGIPVIDGVVSAPSIEHAAARCGGDQDRGGYIAAAAEMARLWPRLGKGAL